MASRRLYRTPLSLENDGIPSVLIVFAAGDAESSTG